MQFIWLARSVLDPISIPFDSDRQSCLYGSADLNMINKHFNSGHEVILQSPRTKIPDIITTISDKERVPIGVH